MTSNIESVCANLKSYNKKIFNFMHQNFILFSEFRRNISILNYENKIKEIYDIMNYISNLGVENLYNENHLNSLVY